MFKTRSSLKKRFKVTGTGKILSRYGYKRHGMTNKNSKMIRNSRSNKVLCKEENKMISMMLQGRVI